MRYKQVPVDGLRILLRLSGRTYAYHSGGSKAPFLCEQHDDGRRPAPAPGLGRD
jgi:hypothetical protein